MRLEQLLKATARRLAIPYETVLKDYAIGQASSLRRERCRVCGHWPRRCGYKETRPGRAGSIREVGVQARRQRAVISRSATAAAAASTAASKPSWLPMR